MTGKSEFEEIFFTNRDGLRLYGRHYRPKTTSSRRPVVCLAGLTRNSRDFHAIALSLSGGDKPRDVFTLDTRGRGQSENDKDWKNYSVPTEMQDAIDFMVMLGLSHAGLLGTSRGGLISMLLATAQPSLVGAVALNDIGPVIEAEGIARIAGYVGRIPAPVTWTDAHNIINDLFRRDFPKVSEEDVAAIARAIFNERDGKPVSGYDPDLGKSFSALNGKIPTLWPQFDAMKNIPVLVLRGENSDILSEATVLEMKRRHPNLTSLVVAQQGHAPLLRDEPTIDAIATFFDKTDFADRDIKTSDRAGGAQASRVVSTSPLSTRRENSV
jgi:pimeloyl-ACP methyl ester carboxylesterase